MKIDKEIVSKVERDYVFLTGHVSLNIKYPSIEENIKPKKE